MKKYPTIRLNVEGHTDNVGSDDYNQRLSESRIASVRRYLTERGISTDRLTTKAFGESRPVNSNDTPEGRQKNRRVEMTGE
jgi:outer membrane protein OmpA-like peptidoglycan-associated protein